MPAATAAPPPFPPRGQLVADEGARVALAVIEQLSPTAQHEVLERVRELLDSDDGSGGRERRNERRAVRALREAAALWQEKTGSPHLSVEGFRALRNDHPEAEWPADSSIRAWIGPGWNDALELAGLDRAPDADVMVAGIGPAFEREECRQAILDYVVDSGAELPSLRAVCRWAKRREIRARPGRRPLSPTPYLRVYREWTNALIDAGLIDADLPSLPATTAERTNGVGPSPAAGGYRRRDLRAALGEVAARLGHSPTSSEFPVERDRLLAYERAEGLPLRAFPSYQTFQNHYGTWDDALRDAGLEPIWDRHGRCRGSEVSDDDIAAALSECYEKRGDPFTAGVYKRWRQDELDDDPTRRLVRRIPDYNTIWKHFGSFDRACRYAGLERALAHRRGA